MSEWRNLSDFDPPREPPGAYDPPGEPAKPATAKFILEPWGAAAFFAGGEEWLVKRILPRRGVAAIYGKPGSFKSFIVTRLAVSVATGEPWAGRRVTQAPVVYIAAEGASGLRKRLAGFRIAYHHLPEDVPFALISTAPNLGATPGDLDALIGAIESANVSPGLIVLDTLAQAMGAGDENGAGMTAFVANATALADRLRCLVLIVHHSGLGDERRLRGHSSLHGALDALILCERREGELSASLTLQKCKDDASDVRLEARLSRVVLAYDEDGDEISTLVVDAIEDAEPATNAPKTKTVPAQQRLLITVIGEAIEEAGEAIRPFGASGPTVSAVDDAEVRRRYYERIAEAPREDDTPKKLADRQRQAFNTALKRCLDAKLIVATLKDGRRLVWLP